MDGPQPDLEHGISTSSLNSGANLLRQTSAVFTAGAGGLHHNSHQSDSPARSSSQGVPRPHLLRQQSSSRMRASPETDVVRDRLHEHVTAEMWQAPICLFIAFIFILVFFGFLFALVFYFFKALLAVIGTWGEPCDQPIKFYFIVHLIWSRLPQILERSLAENGVSPITQMCASGCSTAVSWMIIYWGYTMVNSARTCPKTNPELYYSMKSYIYLQLWFSLFCLIFMLGMCYGARRFMLLAMQMSSNPVGCAKAVHNLPKVRAGDPELLDEDGEVLACPICIEPVSDGAVRTPCGHFFHEECLATWCIAHLDCPLCRQTVGEPDDETNSPSGDAQSGLGGQGDGSGYQQVPSSSSQTAPSPPSPPSVRTTPQRQPTQTSPEREMRSPLLAQSGPGEREQKTAVKKSGSPTSPLGKKEIFMERAEHETMPAVVVNTSVAEQAAAGSMVEKGEEKSISVAKQAAVGNIVEKGEDKSEAMTEVVADTSVAKQAAVENVAENVEENMAGAVPETDNTSAADRKADKLILSYIGSGKLKLAYGTPKLELLSAQKPVLSNPACLASNALAEAEKLATIAKGLSDAAASITGSHPAVADGLLLASVAVQAEADKMGATSESP
mmetsp:Transcript_104799/g.185082  ORF Transcript_104799/g.185082 Transcript_104799/m.185082 type:complete len:615 (+) Transcript_104799:62-1906(+)